MARLLLRDLTPGTAYKIQLRAADGDSFSEWSRRFDMLTSNDTTAPDVPAWAAGPWVVNGDTFVATWVAPNFTLPQNVDFDHYEIEFDDNTKQVVVATNNTSYTLTFDQNRIFFGTPRPTVKVRVRSVDHVGNASAWSSQQSATNPPPANVSSITVTSLMESIKVDWSTVSDIDLIGYKVQVSTTSASTGFSDVYNGPDNSYTHGTIQFATDHYYRVYAVDKFGSISAAPITSGAVRPKSAFTVDTTAPNVPTSLAATITNNANGLGARAAVSWVMASPPTDLAGYYVRFRKVGDTNYSTVPFTSDVLAGTIELQAAFQNYEFQIRAYDWQNNYSAWSGTVTAASPGNAIPANVTGLTGVAGKDSITYSWNAVADLDIRNYEVTFSTSPTFASGNQTFLTGTSTNLTVGGLSTNTTYYARVRAVDIGGNPSAAFSSTDTRTTGTFPTANSITLTATSQVLTSPSGGGATTPATTTVTGTAVGTTITTYDYSVDGAAFSATVPAGVSRTGNVVTITGATMTARTIAVRMSDGTISDTMTVSKNYDGAAGGAGAAGADAYTVLLTNEAQTIAAGTTAANAGVFTTNANAYKGSVAQAVTVGTITGGATGITAAVTNNGTTNPTITFTVTTALTQANGTFTIPVTVAGITFTQIWTWSLAFTGAAGAAGPAGSASDGQAPGAGATPDVLAGLSYLYIKWAATTVNALGAAQNDPVTYEVHLSTTTGFTPSGATKVTEVSGLSAVIDHLPGTNTALAYGTTYFIKIVPKDRDGSGTASAQGSGAISKIASGDVTSIGADLIVPGTGFVNALVVAAGGSLQSSNYSSLSAGWKISNTGIEMNDTGSKIKADAIVTGNLGGPAGVNSVLTIASNTSIVMNGGHLKSNTYNGSGGVTYDPNATAGFYLGNDGLVIAQGKVKAEALSGGTFNAGTINIAAGGKIQGGSWYIDNTGVFVPDGAIAASKLIIGGNGSNMVKPEYSGFEFLTVPSSMIANGATVVTDTTNFMVGKQSLRMSYTGVAGTDRGILLADAFNAASAIPVEAGKTYILSFYYRNNTLVTTTDLRASVWYDTGAFAAWISSFNMQASTAGWVRVSGALTIPAGVTKVVPYIISQAASFDVSLDATQVEERVGSSNAPSTYTQPGMTTVDGGMVRTGALQSTALARDVNGNTIAGLPAWKIDTAGTAVLGDVLIRGKLVMGISGDYANSTSTATDADGNVYVYEDSSKLAGIGSIQSYNYSPGVSGWAIRSNGYAEFLQLKADSISADAIEAVSPDKLNPGTMTADLIIGSSIRSVEKETLYITTKARTGAVVTLTLGTSHTRLIGDRIQVKLDTADANVDTPGKVFATVSAITDTTISYTHPSGGSVTIGATAATGSVYVEGRSVVMSPEGVTLFQNNGIDRIIDLPTDTLLPAYFAGDVEANSLTVKDDFLLQGIDNAVAAGGIFTLNASVVSPSGTPTFNFSWDYVSTWMTNDYTAWKSGLWLDAGRYITSNAFFGVNVFGTMPDGSYNFNLGAADDAGGENQVPYGVIKAADGKFYILVNDSGDGLWKVRRYAATGTGFSTLEATWTYNEASFFGVTATEWKVDGFNGSALKDPVIGYGTPDGTNYYIYIARCNKAGRIIVSRYTTTGTLQANVITNITDNQKLKSINVGAFDYGSYRWVITTEGNANKTATNYVTSIVGIHQSTETFPSPGNQKVWGMCWNGTAFVTLTQNNRLYTHTALANTGTNVWYVKSTFFDGNNSRTMNVSAVSGNGTTTTITTSGAHGYVAGDTIYATGTLAAALNTAYYTVISAPLTTTLTVASAYSGSVGAGGTITNEWETPLSSYAQSTITRRAKLTISSSNIPVGAGVNQPDRARFYFSNTAGGSGSYYRQANANATVSQVFTANPAFSGNTTPQTAFPAGTPAKIVSNNGKLELNSNGYAIFGSTTDVSAAAGNTPALRVGDIAGTHLRIDGNEIMAMSGDTTLGGLTLNSGGTTNITTLNVSGSMTGSTIFGTLRGSEIHANNTGTAGGLFDDVYATAGTTAANINTNGRVIKTASSRRFKENIEPMSLDMAKTVLGIESVTYEWIDKEQYGPGRYPGVIAEQAHEAGAMPWIAYDNDRDKDGNLVPAGFRYAEVTVAHNMLIKELYAEIAALKAEVRKFKS